MLMGLRVLGRGLSGLGKASVVTESDGIVFGNGVSEILINPWGPLTRRG